HFIKRARAFEYIYKHYEKKKKNVRRTEKFREQLGSLRVRFSVRRRCEIAIAIPVDYVREIRAKLEI
mgnify:CR=1